MTAHDLFTRVLVLAALGAAGIPVMLTGSFASSYHGAPPATQEDAARMLRVRADQLDHAYVERWVTALRLEEQWAAVKSVAFPI